MEKIHKFKLDISDGYQVINLPKGSKIVYVGHQGDGIPTVWFRCLTTQYEFDKMKFRVVGTGHPILPPETETYIGTIVANPFVWHIFQGTGTL